MSKSSSTSSTRECSSLGGVSFCSGSGITSRIAGTLCAKNEGPLELEDRFSNPSPRFVVLSLHPRSSTHPKFGSCEGSAAAPATRDARKNSIPRFTTPQWLSRSAHYCDLPHRVGFPPGGVSTRALESSAIGRLASGRSSEVSPFRHGMARSSPPENSKSYRAGSSSTARHRGRRSGPAPQCYGAASAHVNGGLGNPGQVA